MNINRVIDLDTLVLDSGAHDGFAAGACLLEAASYLAGEEFSDHPACVSPVLAAYGRRLNDALPDELRQQLKQYLPDLIGTRTDDDRLEEARAAVASDWVIRTAIPRWLDLAGKDDLAAELRGLSPITTRAQRRALAPRMREIREELWNARLAARAVLVDKIRSEMAKRGLPAAVDVAAAAAAAVDVAADAAAAAAAAVDGSTRYWAVYDAVRAEIRKRITDGTFESRWADIARTNQQDAIHLLGRMIAADVTA